MSPAVASSAYFTTVIRRYARRMWWWSLLPLPMIVWGLCCDVRVAIVGFMILLIILPMISVPAVLRSCSDRRLAVRTGANRFSFVGSTIKCIRQTESPDPDLPPSEELIDTVVALYAATSGKNVVFVTGQGIADFVIVPANMVPEDTMTKFFHDEETGFE